MATFTPATSSPLRLRASSRSADRVIPSRSRKSAWKSSDVPAGVEPEDVELGADPVGVGHLRQAAGSPTGLSTQVEGELEGTCPGLLTGRP